LKVAHITAHVGGGVGAVLKDLILLSKDIESYLLCLDKCKTNFSDFIGVRFSIQGLMYKPASVINSILVNCDVIVVHYWNHPLLAQFLSNVQLPPCRLVFWCHNSGLDEPNIIPNYLSDLAQRIVFTSQCSMGIRNINSLAKPNTAKFLDVVHSARDLSNFIEIGKGKTFQRPGKRLLYMGTVSKSKMHPKAAEIFSQLSRMGCTVSVVGGPEHAQLAAEVKSLGGEINIYGSVDNPIDFYKNADIFVYPLRHDHYGTGEQVILEALASGLPVVSFANPAELAILQDGIDSILKYSIESFTDATLELIDSPSKIKDMSRHAVANVKNNFDVTVMTSKLINIFNEILGSEKIIPIMPQKYNNLSNKLSLYALNSFVNEKIFEVIVKDPNCGVDVVYSHIKSDLKDEERAAKWLNSSKSTPFHYQRYFPDSNDLKAITDRIKSHLRRNRKTK
jgi:glycosyltransferase involved in cell wall biosynthesis